jgi:hypothetical protein
MAPHVRKVTHLRHACLNRTGSLIPSIRRETFSETSSCYRLKLKSELEHIFNPVFDP